ncbi:phage terminase large subunit family protein [Cupriavidus basilensis]|uniref:phage terminase large subunit family protein n=1 Tax=Cupriavidus basilensis TaxID=68895 RepID=UPI00284AE4B2|nr:terminase gpA endonuclease subunit [Cupriavidus basilensis]MDR3382301.1 phage terminase large subunit family protein [Cupriavidus basilensis]
MTKTAKRTLRMAVSRWALPPRMNALEWARKYRFLSSVEADRAGKYDPEVTPYLCWPGNPLEALDDPTVIEVCCQKSAQVAWTSGVLGNILCKWIDLDPSPILGLFPKEGAAKEYMAEKFEPMVSATPRLRRAVDLRSRKSQQRMLFKRFRGGFLKLVGSNSPSSVKSSPIPRIFIEEPDDCNLNLRGQGDSIKLAKERTKTFRRSRVKIVIGGTPTVEGTSTIAAEMELSDKRVGMVPCHHCGEEHALSFDYLKCPEEEGASHPIFGKKVPEKAYYVCPHCGGIWNDAEKRRNVKAGRWMATAPFNGIAGYFINELYSPFPGSVMPKLMENWLTALHHLAMGDESKLVAFTNSSMGVAYSFKGDQPKAEELAERALPYDAGIVPEGGLTLVIGVDVQPDRLEVVVRAYGRGEESWLVRYDRLYGQVVLIQDDVWNQLDKLIFGKYRHARGFALSVAAVSIDSGDGNTSDAVYKYVRSRQGRGVPHVMAVKGSKNADAEIFRKPSAVIDTNKKNTKAAKYGVSVFMVGGGRAKDLLIGERGRVGLEGKGPGRFHVYKTVIADYFEQLLNEVKAPVRQQNGHVIRVWQKKVGKRNEALDCEVYALHATRAAKVHLMQERDWAVLEARLSQAGLFDEPAPPEPLPAPEPAAAPREVDAEDDEDDQDAPPARHRQAPASVTTNETPNLPPRRRRRYGTVSGGVEI